MKPIYLVCAFFLSLGIFSQVFSKPSHHFITIKNDTNHDVSVSELEKNNPQQHHAISARNEKKCNFSKNTDSVEVKVKFGTTTYNVCCPITSGHKTITITENQTLHIRVQ